MLANFNNSLSSGKRIAWSRCPLTRRTECDAAIDGFHNEYLIVVFGRVGVAL